MAGFGNKSQTIVQLIDSFPQAYHLSGFGEWCPGGKRDLKPDYRMSSFGSKEYSQLYLNF
jgi:hypothetical protein